MAQGAKPGVGSGAKEMTMKPRMSIKDELIGTALIFAVLGLAFYGLAKIIQSAYS